MNFIIEKQIIYLPQQSNLIRSSISSILVFIFIIAIIFITNYVFRYIITKFKIPREQAWYINMVYSIKKPLKIFTVTTVIYFTLIPFILYLIKKDSDYFMYLHLMNNIYSAISVFCIALFLLNLTSIVRKNYVNKEIKKQNILETVLSLTLKWVNFIIPIFALNLILEALELSDKIGLYVFHIKEVLAIISISWLFFILVYTFENYILSKFNITTKNNAKNRGIITQVQVLKKIVLSIIVFISIALTLLLFDTFKQYGASLLASAGIVGIAVSFAAQKTLSNLLVGFQLAFTQPIRFDDVIVVEGEWGKVEEITLTYIVVCLWDQRRLILPISYFLEKPFQNWTKKTSELIGTIFVYLDFSVPLDKLEAETLRICQSTPLWDGRVVCVQVTNLSANYMEVRIIASSPDAPTSFDLRCYLRRKIIEYVRENYPHSFSYQRTLVTMEKSNLSPQTQSSFHEALENVK